MGMHGSANELAIAIELIKLGARTGTIKTVTKLNATLIRRTIREITGKPSVTGSSSYMPDWFFKTSYRQMHCLILDWCSKQQPVTFGAAEHLLRSYTLYLKVCELAGCAVDDMISINRASMLFTKLISTGKITTRTCKSPTCKNSYLVMHGANVNYCPVCAMHKAVSCLGCGQPISLEERANPKGRPCQYHEECRPAVLGATGS